MKKLLFLIIPIIAICLFQLQSKAAVINTASLSDRVVTTVGDPGSDTSVPSEQAVREALTSAVSDSGFVKGPSSATADNIPQWNGTTGKLLKDGLTLATTVGDPGADTNIPSEQAVREALAGLSQEAVKVDSLIVKKDDASYGAVMTYNETTGDLDIEIF